MEKLSKVSESDKDNLLVHVPSEKSADDDRQMKEELLKKHIEKQESVLSEMKQSHEKEIQQLQEEIQRLKVNPSSHT